MPVDIDPIAKHYLEEGHYLAKFYLSPKVARAQISEFMKSKKS